jgi:hypothetical protein
MQGCFLLGASPGTLFSGLMGAFENTSPNNG